MHERAILLDTHALIWWATADKALSRKVKRLIEAQDTTVVVSAATAWEIATKVRLKKLVWPSDESVEAYCIAQGFARLPVSFSHAEKAGSWSHPHGDPFDRMLAAQSAIEAIRLATNDAAVASFGIDTVW